MLFIVLQEVHNMREKLVRGDLDTNDYNSQMREKTKLLPLTVSLTNINDSFPYLYSAFFFHQLHVYIPHPLFPISITPFFILIPMTPFFYHLFLIPMTPIYQLYLIIYSHYFILYPHSHDSILSSSIHILSS